MSVHEPTRLIERLLADGAFRAAFRRDPTTACRAAGFDALAAELGRRAELVPVALDSRESRSSLAGMIAAAAVEGVGIGRLIAEPSAWQSAGSPGDASGVPLTAGPWRASDASVAVAPWRESDASTARPPWTESNPSAARPPWWGSDASALTDPVADRSGAGPKALAALRAAMSQLGRPYVYGQASPDAGFDCSGLVMWAYAGVDVPLPRTTYEQIHVGQNVARSDLLRGDLVFFRNRAGIVHHVGMSLGGDGFVHAPHRGDVVKISSLAAPGYADEFAGGRRVVPAQAGGELWLHASAGAGRPQTVVFHAVPAPGSERTDTVRFAAVPAPPLGGPAASVELVAADAATSWPGDDASRRAIAVWMGRAAAAAGLPPELPVMAALQESSLRNLPYGTGDSVGYFQMRESVWSADYPGYLERPELQLQWFVEHARAARAAAISGGHTSYGAHPSSWGAWIADIEQPAAKNRGLYQRHLHAARQLLARAV